MASFNYNGAAPAAAALANLLDEIDTLGYHIEDCYFAIDSAEDFDYGSDAAAILVALREYEARRDALRSEVKRLSLLVASEEAQELALEDYTPSHGSQGRDKANAIRKARSFAQKVDGKGKANKRHFGKRSGQVKRAANKGYRAQVKQGMARGDFDFVPAPRLTEHDML